MISKILNKKIFGLNIADLFIIIIIILMSSLLIIKNVRANRELINTNRLLIEISIPNLDPEVASKINLSDRIIDKDGNSILEIVEKVEKKSEHPIIDKNGNIVVAQHPKLFSLFLKLRTIKPTTFKNGIKYNWQVIKIGGSLIWETKYCRFVGLVRNIIEETK